METPELDRKIESNFDRGLSYEEMELAVNSGKYAGEAEAKYDSVHFIVHPGWAAKNYDLDWEEEERKDKFLQRFYPEYISGMQQMLDDAGENDLVHVIHEEGGKSHAETIIDQLTEETPEVKYTQSLDEVGEVPEENLPEVKQSINQLRPDGEMTLNGEIRGRCDRRFQYQIEDHIPAHIEMQKGETFPPEPTFNYIFM